MKLNETQYRFLEPQMPYECKKCGRGAPIDNYCVFCDDGLLNYMWRRGGIQTLVPALVFGLFWVITDIHLFLAPFGLLLLWNSYLFVTAQKRMRKHFKTRDPKRN